MDRITEILALPCNRDIYLLIYWALESTHFDVPTQLTYVSTLHMQ